MVQELHHELHEWCTRALLAEGQLHTMKQEVKIVRAQGLAMETQLCEAEQELVRTERAVAEYEALQSKLLEQMP